MDKFFLIAYVFFAICFFIPSIAYAYLDPGTGNALIYVLLSIVGAFLYFVKGIFYKVLNHSNKNDKKTNKDIAEYKSIIVFSEGKAYWHVFKPVIESLIKKKQKFTYYTMDFKDPCLLIDSEYMDNCYIGSGNFAYSKIGNLNTNVVLSTTPNIGSEGYPIPRSKGIKKLVHIFHAFTDFSFYHKGSLDHYDAVLLMGEFEIQIIRKLEKLRNLPEKELVPAGLPYIDELIKKNEDFRSKRNANNKSRITVLFAPSWGEKGFLSCFGSEFIENLARKDFNLIIRPHPQSLKSEKKLLQNIQKELQKYQNVAWDFNPDGAKSFQEADILVSDTSGVRFDFAIVYQKPYITVPLEIPKDVLNDFEIADLGFSWTEREMQKIGYGYTLKNNEIEYLDKIILKILREKNNGTIVAFRNKNIYNLGKSGEVIADYLIDSNNCLQNETKRE